MGLSFAEKISGEKTETESEELVFDTPEKIECIKTRTQELINKIIKQDIEGVFFLDRSARPISWMLREAWDEKKLKRPKPEINFLNFGQEKQALVHFGGGRENISYTAYIEKGKLEFALNELKEADKTVELKKRIEEIETDYGKVEDYGGDIGYRIKLSDFGEALLLEEKFYRKFFTPDIIRKWTKKFAAMNNKVIFVDDYSHSGGTQKTLQKMFEYNFPKTKFNFHAFFKSQDKDVFPLDKETAKRFISPDPGLVLPWTLLEGKAYTLMADEQPDDKSKLTSKPEKLQVLREKGLAFKKEIKQIFAD